MRLPPTATTRRILVETTDATAAQPLHLAVAEMGRGGRPLLMVHGFTGGKEDFGDFMAPLANLGWHVVTIDLRGHGSSDAPPNPVAYTFEILSNDLATLIAALGWRSCFVVGHSMGGVLAQLLAMTHPELVNGLVLLDSFCGPVLRIEMSLVELGTAIVRQLGMTGLAQALAARRAGNPEPGPSASEIDQRRPGYQAYSESKLLATSPDLWVSLAPRFLTLPSYVERLRKLTVPCAVIVGEYDLESLEHSRRMARAVPDATLDVIAGAGHSPQFESPDRFWEILRTRLDQMASETLRPVLDSPDIDETEG